MSNTMPFESQVANITHEQWLYSEAQKMLETKGLGAENLCTWQGSVYGAFDLESDDIHERTEQDWGLSPLGENGEEELPALIIQSCWAHEYKHMFDEMQEWMKRGGGVVQMAILLKWTLEVPEPGDPVLHVEVEVFEYAPKIETQYRRTLHEKVSSTEEKELQAVKITARQLFAGKKPRGRVASYALNLTDLWFTALDIFDAEVEDWIAQGQVVAAEGSRQVTVSVSEQAGGVEYETDEEEGGDVDGGFENGVDERLQGNSISVATSVLATQSRAAAIAMAVESETVPGGAGGLQVKELKGIKATEVGYIGRAVGEDAEIEAEPSTRGTSDIEPASTTQHPQAATLAAAEVTTTIQTATVVHQSSPQSIEPAPPGTSRNVTLTSHVEEISEIVEIDELLPPAHEVVPEVIISLAGAADPEALEGACSGEGETTGEDTLDLQSKAATASMATTHAHKISVEGGTVIESHTEEYIVTENSSTLPPGSYTHAQESMTQSSYTREGSTGDIIVPPKASHLEVSATQDSGLKTGTLEVFYDQTLTFHEGASTPVDFPCPHCLSNQCCHGPVSPLRHLPRDFMSAGVIGPFSWYGFVVYLSLSTLQPVSGESIEKSRPNLIERVQGFTKEVHEEFPPEDVGPLLLVTTIETTTVTEAVEILGEQRNRSCGGGVSTEVTGAPSPGASSPTQTTKTETRLAAEPPMLPEPGSPVNLDRGVFQSPEPKSTLLGRQWNTTSTKHSTQQASQQWIGTSSGRLQTFPGPTPGSPGAMVSEVTTVPETTPGADPPDWKVDTDALGRSKDVREAVAWEQRGGIKHEKAVTPENEPTGLGIIIEPQQPAAPSGDRHVTANAELEIKTVEKVVKAETVITQENTTTNEPGESPKVADDVEIWQIVSGGGPASEIGATIGHVRNVTSQTTETAEVTVNSTGPRSTKWEAGAVGSETITTEEQFTQGPTITTDDTKITEKTLPKAPNMVHAAVIGCMVTEETTQTVDHRFAIPETITKRKEVTVAAESTDDGHLLQQAAGSSETAEVTMTKETETSKRLRNVNLFAPTSTRPGTVSLAHDDSVFLSESDGERGEDTFAEDRLGSSYMKSARPVLSRSLANDSVQSFESFESIPGPEDKLKVKRSKREKVMKVVAKAFDAVKPPRLGRRKHKANISLRGDESASEVTLAAEETTTTDKDLEGHQTTPTLTDDLATIPPMIVSQMQQKLSLGPGENVISPPMRRLSKITRRQSGSSTFIERPRSRLQRTHSVDETRRGTQVEGKENTFSHDELLMRKESTTTIDTRSERRRSDDSTFSHVIVSESESIETAPPLTPGLGGESDNLKVDKRKRRMVKRTSITGTGTATETSKSDDSTDSKTVASEIHIHDCEHSGAKTHTYGGTATSTTVAHASACQHFHSTGPGLIQCDCSGEELTKYAAPPPGPASTADLIAQLQSLLAQLQDRPGKVVIPRPSLGVNMTCEIAETEEEEIEVQVEVKVKYKSKKSMEHVGLCERTRGLLGASGTCPIIEEMLGGDRVALQ